MKACVVLLAFTFCAFALAQSNKQIPKGIHEAEQASTAAEKSIPAPAALPHRNPEQLQKDAAELARLADSIPPAVEQVDRGVLHKDLNERLKHIEKLSKHLRSELSSN